MNIKTKTGNQMNTNNEKISVRESRVNDIPLIYRFH